MYQDTNDKKLVELNNSVKHQKFEHIAQVEYMQQEYNELKTKVGTWRLDLGKIRICGWSTRL